MLPSNQFHRGSGRGHTTTKAELGLLRGHCEEQAEA